MDSQVSEQRITSVPAGKHGQPLQYDPEFRGPVKNRSCTDIIFLFLFVSFIVGWVVVAIFAFREGDPRVLIYPTDTEGNICGIGKLEKKPYLYYFNILSCANPRVIYKGCLTPQVCVEKCPNETFVVDPTDNSDAQKAKLICKYDVKREEKTVADLISKDDCASIYLKSFPLIGRCIPQGYRKSLNEEYLLEDSTLRLTNIPVDQVQNATTMLTKFLSVKEMGEKIFSDLKTSWHLIVGGLVLSMLVSLLWIVLMRWLAGIMVWLSIVIVLVFMAGGCYYSTVKYMELMKKPGSDAKFRLTINLKSYLALKDTWLAFAIITGVVFAILFLVLVFLRKRIRIAIALIKEASRAVGSIIISLVFPLVPYTLMLAFFVFWAAVALYIASSGKASFMVSDAPEGSLYKNGSICNPKNFNATSEGVKCLFRTYGLKDNLFSAQVYNMFGLFWGLFFAIGIGQVTLAGTFSTYYWTLNKSNLPSLVLCTGFYRCVRYHMGSVAFGSMLIALVRTIRVMLEYVNVQCKKYDNRFTKFLLWCMRCCFWCLEKLLRFISKNAFIMIAIYGENFCTSAKRAFMLVLRNVLRVVVLDKVTDFLLFIGKLVVVASAAVASFYFFTSKKAWYKDMPSLHYNLMPPIFITLGSYIIASGFFNVYSMAVDTLFLCFLEDCERNDGSPEKPYYMSKELMKILDKTNKLKEPLID